MPSDSIAYYLPRLNSLKLVGPLIAEQRRRRSPLEPVVVVPVPPLAGVEGKLAALAAHRATGQIADELGPAARIETVASGASFMGLIRALRVRAVVHVGLHLPEDVVARAVRPSRADGVAWCSVGHIGDELIWVARSGPALLENWDFVGTLGPEIVAAARALVAERWEDLSLLERLVPVGFVELDQFASIDRTAARRKYGIPLDAPVIFFSTATRYGLPRSLHAAFFGIPFRRVRPGRMARLLWGRRWPGLDYLATYPQILKELRTYARRHGALLVGKTRAKHRDPPYVRAALDMMFDDGGYYPFRTLELLAASDMYAGGPSASSLEAMFAGLRSRVIAGWPEDVNPVPPLVSLRNAIYHGPAGAWSDRGVATMYRTYRLEEWRAFQAWARRGAWDDGVDPDARHRQATRIFGFDDCRASARFMDRLEACLR